MPTRAMGLRSFQLSLTGAIQQLSSTSIYAHSVEVYNDTAQETQYLGGSDVSSTLGRPIATGASFSLPEVYTRGSNELYDLSSIYVIGTAAQTLRVIYATYIG
mgnify:CR=1 FL=1